MKDSPAVVRACAYLDGIKEMLRAKNRAYGDSVAVPINVFSKLPPAEGIKIRLDDKLKRIALGDGSGNEDAIGDIIGYLAFLATIKGE